MDEPIPHVFAFPLRTGGARPKLFRRWFNRIRPIQASEDLFCAYCLRRIRPLDGKSKIPREDRRTIDHVQPKCRGGSRGAHANQVAACSDCNQSKGRYSLIRFLRARKIAAERGRR